MTTRSHIDQLGDKNTFPSMSLLDFDPNLIVGMGYLTVVLSYYLRKKIILSAYSCSLLAAILVSHRLIAFIDYRLVQAAFMVVCTLYHWSSMHRQQLPVNGKYVLITGCDRGIGHELAKCMDREGYRVFAGCLQVSGQGPRELVGSCSPNLRTLQLDVQDSAQIAQAAETVRNCLGNDNLWAVINNAGICLIGNIEIMSLEDIERQMRVNFFGPLNMCKTFLPFVRRRLVPVAHMGVYCASKAALAILTESLRYEQKLWGVHVSTIVPSGYRTGILAYDKQSTAERWWKVASPTVKQDYGRECFTPTFKMPNHESKTTPDLSTIVNTILRAVSEDKPQAFYYSGFLARTLPFIYTYLPPVVREPLMKVFAGWFVLKPKALEPKERLNGLIAKESD
ncbi:11-beta-hydroxysteroid dehydrogenase type 2-like isoform X2 [Dreissena polymorpha]|uniref:11-beta-hydroxysteroid dehydrogenase type 2-like isoform X2 n=1 Tax=Dreissena polymorpha TaxID=45954 RepID=UPI0022646C70|nr:11-beta-hydroxysteroid dehydrogenase type 2-like isoform X2 [Dreissena polymorpha]